MVTYVTCDNCKFAKWDMTLFRDAEEGRWYGGRYIPPYSEQFDVYCGRHECFYMEQETPTDCQDGIKGPNNYYEVCTEYYKQRDEFLNELKNKDNEKDTI